MHVLLAGSSGFLGTHLSERLRHDGHRVTPLVRRAPQAGQRRWDPYAGPLDPATLEDVDVVVNLAGSPTLGNPHSEKWAHGLERSRVTTTRVLADAIAASDRKPAFLAGNGISFYGDHGDQRLDETADSRGAALLTRVTRRWQAATTPASDAGARVAVIRTAPVLDAASAPLKQLRMLFSTGLGGRLGSGRQYFPVVSLRDWVGGVAHLVTSEVGGPVNLCAPQVPTNGEFTAALGAALHRPTLAPVPAIAIRAAAGPMAPEVLNSVRGVPQALLDDGYTFADRDISAILATALA